jgi:hypothetical protein
MKGSAAQTERLRRDVYALGSVDRGPVRLPAADDKRHAVGLEVADGDLSGDIDSRLAHIASFALWQDGPYCR